MTQDFAKKKSTSTSSRSSKQSRSSKTSSSTKNNQKPAKRKVNTRKKTTPPKKAPAWAWLIIGLLVGAFTMFLANLSKQADTAKPVVTKAEKPKATNKSEESQVRFDFYEILREQEVEVDAKVIENTPQKNNYHYFLQAGSFRQAADADKMRAKLILLNLPANVENHHQ